MNEADTEPEVIYEPLANRLVRIEAALNRLEQEALERRAILHEIVTYYRSLPPRQDHHDTTE